MVFDGCDVGSGSHEVTVVCDHVATRRSSHSFLFRVIQPICADNADIGSTLVVRFRTVRNEVNGVGACDAGAQTLDKAPDFVGVDSVPFGTLPATEEGR